MILSCYQKATCPEVLYDEVIEVRERVVLVQQRSKIELPNESFLVTASTGEKVSSWRYISKKQYFIHLIIWCMIWRTYFCSICYYWCYIYGWYLKLRYCKTKAKSQMINNFFSHFLISIISYKVQRNYWVSIT